MVIYDHDLAFDHAVRFGRHGARYGLLRRDPSLALEEIRYWLLLPSLHASARSFGSVNLTADPTIMGETPSD
jgi:hypothetical protein